MPRKTPELIWESIKEYYLVRQSYASINGIKLDEEKKQKFIDTFVSLYCAIKTNYMQDSVKTLDHHKQAAIIIYSLISSSAITSTKYPHSDYKNNPKEANEQNPNLEVFVEPESVALKVGLEYMLGELNASLAATNQKKIDNYAFPIPLSCTNDYLVVLIRQLFYDFTYGNIVNPEVYVLSLANTLYLIEYINLLDNEIDVKELGKYVRLKEKDI